MDQSLVKVDRITSVDLDQDYVSSPGTKDWVHFLKHVAHPHSFTSKIRVLLSREGGMVSMGNQPYWPQVVLFSPPRKLQASQTAVLRKLGPAEVLEGPLLLPAHLGTAQSPLSSWALLFSVLPSSF